MLCCLLCSRAFNPKVSDWGVKSRFAPLAFKPFPARDPQTVVLRHIFNNKINYVENETTHVNREIDILHLRILLNCVIFIHCGVAAVNGMR